MLPVLPTAHTLADGMVHLKQEMQALPERATVIVGAAVGVRREEGVDQVAVRCMDLNAVEPGLLAAGLGREELRRAAESVFFTGIYWSAAVPMAAAIATINTLREEGGIEQMRAMGQRFRNGLEQQQPSSPAWAWQTAVEISRSLAS